MSNWPFRRSVRNWPFWRSNLDLHRRDDETESFCSATESYDDPKETPVGPFLQNLFQKQLYTDVEFIFKSTNECLSAHRVVLAAKCEYFADLLFNEKKNRGTGTKMRAEIDIINIPFTVFKDIVNYFYTDDIDFPDLPTVLDIHSASNSFKVQSLLDLSEQYINEFELTEDNVCSTLKISNSKFADSLKSRCIDFIKNYTMEVINSPDFEKSSFNTVREIVNLQDLNLRCESEMLEAVLRWINVQPDNVKAELKNSLLKCIRFVSFTSKKFRDVIKRHPELLTTEEALDTLIYLNDPTQKNMKKLPEWMNGSQRTFLQSKNNLRIKRKKQIDHGKLKIPLIASSRQQEVTNLTSILKLKFNKGSYKINGIKIRLADFTNDGNTVAVIVLKVSFVPKGFRKCFSRTIDCKETMIEFPKGILVYPGQLLNLEAQIHACRSCKFLQYDDSMEENIVSEKFQFSVSSKPKQGRLYFLSEVLFKSLTANEIRNFKREIQRKGQNKVKENQKEKVSTDDR